MDNNRIEKYRDASGKFVKGYKHSELPMQIKEKISGNLGESWKQRDGFIADIVNETPYIYNCWRGILFSEKGEKAGVCDRWREFRSFYTDVRPTYQKGLVFRRIDNKAPFSVDNFVWCTKDEAAYLRGDMIVIEYKGEFLTLKQISIKYNQSLGGIKNRYYKREQRGYSVEEIIFGRKRNKGSRLAKDITEKGVNIRAKASKMISSYKNKDYKNNTEICDISIDWMIDNILTQKCIYCGDTKRIGCDRIDNLKGHTKDNVVPCCVECNTARNNNFTFEEMKILGEAIRKIKHNRR